MKKISGEIFSSSCEICFQGIIFFNSLNKNFSEEKFCGEKYSSEKEFLVKNISWQTKNLVKKKLW